MFTGLTGSGKTTITRHVFEIEQNANMPKLSGNTIIIPIDFNRSQRSEQDAILSSLRNAIQTISDTYNIAYPDIDNEEFYNYIKEIRPDFLYLNAMHTSKTPYRERLVSFLELSPVPFASCQLQYVMDHHSCSLDLVILIVDNIEAFLDSKSKTSKNRYLAPVIEAFKLAECIEQRKSPTKWCFNMVIACRHHIWRIIKGEFADNSAENVLLQSFVTTEVPYDLARPVAVNAIIQERDNVFAKRQRNPQKWNDAVKIVNTVLKTMENSIGDFVLQIELKDLRKSMTTMRNLILHKGLQKKSDEDILSGAFQIDSIDQFDLSRVNLIRIIGLDKWKYYSGMNSIIPNLLYNEQQPGFELYPLLALKYFLDQCDYEEPAWDNPVSISQFYDRMQFVFGNSENNIKKWKNAVRFLIQKRLLLRSADQPQNEVPGLSLDEIDKIECVYVSGAAVTLWKELGKSSALFQLFIDDVWIDDQYDFFTEEGNDVEHCLQYLTILQKIEMDIYNTARNRSYISAEAYLDAFGNSAICKQLSNGIISSLEAITTSGDSRLQLRIKTAKNTLEKANMLYKELTEWENARTMA